MEKIKKIINSETFSLILFCSILMMIPISLYFLYQDEKFYKFMNEKRFDMVKEEKEKKCGHLFHNRFCDDCKKYLFE